MTRRPPSDIPDSHRRAPTRFLGVTEHGLEFDLEVRDVRRRANTSQLVRSHIAAVTRGRPLTNDDLYQSETEITLFIRGRNRVDIRLNPNGTYSIGHRTHRSLKETVKEHLDRFAPAPAPGPAP